MEKQAKKFIIQIDTTAKVFGRDHDVSLYMFEVVAESSEEALDMAIDFLEAAGYSDAEIDDLCISTFEFEKYINDLQERSRAVALHMVMYNILKAPQN
jgi:hypothetical protein